VLDGEESPEAWLDSVRNTKAQRRTRAA
jgi:hypothetical protein